MTEARWQQVKALFQATVERPPSERVAFLALAAGDDNDLRREVESLLDSDSSAAGFTDRLPFGNVSAALDSSTAVFPSGDSNPTGAVSDPDVGPYRIIGWLGAGGMGEVFRARDSKLNRDVALKVLPIACELDADRLARFRREAHALAALNHPHIAAIYGLEESSGRQALVLELVEGATLAARIADGPLPVRQALSLARQIAEALEAAHEKGIIHRDLKPANIKVTPAGKVKVLDFGLAKTALADLHGTDASHPSAESDATRVGAILGTAAYMSPEQARGHEVDARTDIWAFGCVLFEMLTGRTAFAATGTPEILPKVLQHEPDWSRLPNDTPAKVQQLLRQCLQKVPDKRPRSIAEARAIIDAVLAPRHPGSRTWAAVAATVIVATVGAYMWGVVDRTPPSNRSEWVQLTSLDSVTQPALSPDGRMLAFIRGPSTFVSPGQLYIKRLPDGEPVALTSDSLPKMSPVFSPDGRRIAYTVNDGNSWDTWEVPTPQGEARPWLRNASGLTWVGSDVLFSEVRSGLHMAIVKSSESRTRSRVLYLPPHESGMAHRSYVSPDRRSVLVVEMDERGIWLPCRVLPIDGGGSQQVGPSPAKCTDAAWSPDGRWMYFTADAGDGFHIWRQRFPAGRPEQVTSGPTEEQGLAVAPDGKSLITSVGLTQRAVWMHDASGERQISLEGYAYWPLLSADGRKICFRVTKGVGTGQSPSELWLADSISGHTRRLFPDRIVTGYDLSGDDRVVAAILEKDGRSRIWLASLDGRKPPQQIAGVEGDNPRFDGNGHILFLATEDKASFLYRIGEDGNGRRKIAQVGSHVLGTVSPDGEWISGIGVNNRQILMLSTSGKDSFPVFPYSQTSRMRWSFDGRRAFLSIQYGQASAFGIGRTYVIPVAQGSVLPQVPPGGFRTEAQIAALAGVQVLPYADVAPGPSSSAYAFSRTTTTRNLYRIPIP